MTVITHNGLLARTVTGRLATKCGCGCQADQPNAVVSVVGGDNWCLVAAGSYPHAEHSSNVDGSTCYWLWAKARDWLEVVYCDGVYYSRIINSAGGKFGKSHAGNEAPCWPLGPIYSPGFKQIDLTCNTETLILEGTFTLPGEGFDCLGVATATVTLNP